MWSPTEQKVLILTVFCYTCLSNVPTKNCCLKDLCFEGFIFLRSAQLWVTAMEWKIYVWNKCLRPSFQFNTTCKIIKGFETKDGGIVNIFRQVIYEYDIGYHFQSCTVTVQPVGGSRLLVATEASVKIMFDRLWHFVHYVNER